MSTEPQITVSQTVTITINGTAHEMTIAQAKQLQELLNGMFPVTPIHVQNPLSTPRYRKDYDRWVERRGKDHIRDVPMWNDRIIAGAEDVVRKWIDGARTTLAS